MGAFESVASKQVTAPADLPSVEEIMEKHPQAVAARAIYRTNDGQRFRIVPARWVPVRKRGETAKGAKKK